MEKTLRYYGNLVMVGLLGFMAQTHASPAITISQNSGSIGRYDIYELTLTGSSASYANPWDDVKISTVFTGPSGQFTVGGFYYDVNTWKVRFAPEAVGSWTWSLTFSAPDGTYSTNGSFTVSNSSNSGFLRVNPTYTRHFYTEGDNKVFYPIGFNDCVGVGWPDTALSSTLAFGMDGTTILDYSVPGVHYTASNTTLVPLNAYFRTYSQQGKDNYFRAGPGNCAFNLYDALNVNGTGENIYDIRNGQLWDGLVSELHADGIKYQMEIIANPQALAPHFDLSNAAVKASVLDYHQYILNRYAAYVDIWELFNEQEAVPQPYLDAITGFLNANDPYHHPMAVSFDQPADNTSALAVSAGLHTYYGYDLTNLNFKVASACNGEKTAQNANKPLINGEAGMYMPSYNNYASGHYRDILWTDNMNQCSAIFWNSSALKFINAAPGTYSNMYIGPQERLESTVFSNFISGFDPAAQPLSVRLSPTGSTAPFTAYVLGSPIDIGGYFHSTANADPSSVNTSISGATVTLSIPASGMSGQWIDPATGNVLRSFNPSPGQQTLSIPSLILDIALRIRSGSGTTTTTPPRPPRASRQTPSLKVRSISSWNASTITSGTIGTPR
jgi:hypothetical protein